MRRVPFSSVPLTLPQSRTSHWPSANEISACLRDRNLSRMGMVQSDARPSVIVWTGSDNLVVEVLEGSGNFAAKNFNHGNN